MLDRLDRPIRWLVITLVLAVMLSALLASQARADGPLLFVEIAVEREEVRVDERGREVVERAPVAEALPGEVLVYTLRAVNRGDGPALGARIEDPIPPGTVLMLDSLDGTAVPSQVSLDGGRSWQGFPAWVDLPGEDGAPRRVPAAADAYTHLRWELGEPLAPGASRAVSFKVRVQ